MTSHHSRAEVRERAISIGTKILPKLLASEVPISIGDQKDKIVDLVLVDDDQSFAQNLMLFVFNDKTVDYFEDPHVFQEKASQYPKDTCIYLDHHFGCSDLKGLELAKILHQQGYTRLHLLSGETFKQGELPTYLTAIRKDNIDSIVKNVSKP